MNTVLSAAQPAFALLAYIGPGPGLTMLAALIGMLATLGIALWTVALWPLRAMIRKRRTSRLRTGITESDQWADNC